MSFPRAFEEIAAIERQVKELERQAEGKKYELARLEGSFQSSADSLDSLRAVVEALTNKSASEVLRVLPQFNDQHQCLETGMNVFKVFPRELHQELVDSIVNRLKNESDDAVLIEIMRLVRGLLKESRANCSNITQNAFDLFLARITRKQSSNVRDAAARCFQFCVTQNSALRNALIANEQAIDRLTSAVEEIGIILRSPDLSSNAETARLVLMLKQLFEGTSDENDKTIGRLLIRSGFVSATVARMSLAYLEIADMATKTLKKSDHALLSTTFEGISRGTVLIDGFRFLYVVAIISDEDMLQAMLKNDGLPTLSGEALERCDLSDPNLGLGDRYVFLQTHIMLAVTPEGAPKKDTDNLDAIKGAVCSLLMFADKAPGFVAYIQRHGVARALFDLIDRETTRSKMPGGKEDGLLPILVAVKTLVDNNDDFKEQMQDLFFERLLPELNHDDYNTQEEFNQAAERRHFAGRSIPDTVFGKVVQLLTSFDDHVKRFAGELLYYLCDNDPQKVTHLVGFGHAAHLLAVKGGMLGQISGSQ